MNYFVSLQLVVADALVGSEQRPALLSDFRKPFGVFNTRFEAFTVTFVFDIQLIESRMNWSAIVKAFVQEQNKVFKRRLPWTPTGWPLRFPCSSAHIPSLNRLATLEHET